MNRKYQIGKCVFFISMLVLSNSLLAHNSWIETSILNIAGFSSAEGIPTIWTESNNIRWKTEIHGKGWSTPVIVGDQIWLTTATGDGKKMYAVCVSKETGKILHDILVLENAKVQWKNEQNTYATPSPVAAGGYIYAEFGTYGTACIEAKSGRIIWKRTDVSPDGVPHGPASAPIIYKDLIILHHEGINIRRISALDRNTGKTVWQVHRPEELYVDLQEPWRKSHASPIIITVNGKDQLISVGSQICQSFDPATGKEIWSVRYIGGDSTVSSPLFWNGIVYINTGLKPTELWAVNPDGKGDVTETKVLWKCKDNVPGISTPVVKNGLLFMVDEKGQLSCLDAKTGQLIWREKLQGNYSFNSAPVWIEDKVYLTNMEGQTTIIRAERKFTVIAQNKLDGQFIARPVVSGNSLIMRSDSKLYRIDE